MSEKMLVTQALDERDLLLKKINDKIDKLKLVDVKRKNEEKETMEDYARGGWSADSVEPHTLLL